MGRRVPHGSFAIATGSGPTDSEAQPAGRPEAPPVEGLPGILGDRVQTIKAEVAGIREQLAKSGPASGGWTSSAFEVFGKWQKESTLSSKVSFSDFRCYAGGCSITATYGDEGAFADGAHELQESESFKAWPGPKFRSGPVPLPSGAIETTWALFKL
jgi:hypothetical protein